jgi:hypothetical protein
MKQADLIIISKLAFTDQTSSTSATGCCFRKMGDMDLLFDKANL